MDIPKKEDRPILLVFVTLSYMIGIVALYLVGANWLVWGLMFCYCTNTLLVLIINFFWKISVHSMGISGPATALFFINPQSGLFLICLLLGVMWSRIHLHMHNMAQVIAGAFLGIIFTGFQLLIINLIFT